MRHGAPRCAPHGSGPHPARAGGGLGQPALRGPAAGGVHPGRPLPPGPLPLPALRRLRPALRSHGPGPERGARVRQNSLSLGHLVAQGGARAGHGGGADARPGGGWRGGHPPGRPVRGPRALRAARGAGAAGGRGGGRRGRPRPGARLVRRRRPARGAVQGPAAAAAAGGARGPAAGAAAGRRAGPAARAAPLPPGREAGEPGAGRAVQPEGESGPAGRALRLGGGGRERDGTLALCPA